MIQTLEQHFKQEVVLLQDHHQPSTKIKKDEVKHMVSLMHSCLPVSMGKQIVVTRLQWSEKNGSVLRLEIL